MKNIVIIAFLILLSRSLTAQFIPDPNFAQAIKDHCPTCIDEVNYLTADAKKLTNLTISIHHITDLTGLHGFSSLTHLNCENNDLTTLPKLPSTIRTLLCGHNKITELPELPGTLLTLYCQDNKLTKLPKLPATLTILECSENQIATLPELPEMLKTLFCAFNKLTALPNLPTKLTGLLCNNNNLQYLPKLPENIIRVGCQFNPNLSCLPKLPESLLYLDIPKSIKCLQNTIDNLDVYAYTEQGAQKVNLPQCTPIQSALCPQETPAISEKDYTVLVSPNPTEGELNVRLVGYTFQKATIFDMAGRTRKLTTTLPVHLFDLPTGVYFIKIETDGETVLKKIIRQ